ncbi:MAG TPA: carboxyltransferase domain-containing protein, partial [Pedobacter sp.]
MSQYLAPLTIYALGEQAVSIEFDNRIDPELAGYIRGFDNDLRTAPFPGFVTTVIAYATLTVYYNIEQVAGSAMAGQSCFERVSAYLQSLKSSGNFLKSQKSELIQVPVCYGSDLGPDLSALAKDKKMDERSIIDL